MLATALAGECIAIITGDKDLLILNPFRGIQVLAPATFWKWEAEPVRFGMEGTIDVSTWTTIADANRCRGRRADPWNAAWGIAPVRSEGFRHELERRSNGGRAAGPAGHVDELRPDQALDSGVSVEKGRSV